VALIQALPFKFPIDSTMKITRSEVEKTARLARLELSDAEVERMTSQLDTILNYAAKLDELDTTGIATTTHDHAAGNAFREDEVRPSLPRETALVNGPQHNNEAFVVPKIIG
jgi:aspartyl-tRNA(Asn)/glutamyl-tRNA(Gln) amidotransferase subunit C